MDAANSTPVVTEVETEPITLHIGTTIHAAARYGPDWFALSIDSGRHQTTVYLRRAQLRALRVDLDRIDAQMPDPAEASA